MSTKRTDYFPLSKLVQYDKAFTRSLDADLSQTSQCRTEVVISFRVAISAAPSHVEQNRSDRMNDGLM